MSIDVKKEYALESIGLIKQALADKGVTVPEGATLRQLHELVADIEQSGGSGEIVAGVQYLEFNSNGLPTKAKIIGKPQKYCLYYQGYIEDVELVSIEAGDFAVIPAYAFYDCTRLEEIVLPAETETIGESCFCNSGLTSIDLRNVRKLENRVFYSCKALTGEIDISGITSFGSYVFSSCTKLSGAVLNDSLTTIEGGLFAGCTNLALEELPDSVESIGGYSFQKCTAMTLDKLPASLTTLADYSFPLSGITISEIPSGVTRLGNSVFSECTGITNINAPGVTNISGSAFSKCTNLATAVIGSEGNPVTNISSSAFSNCTNLTDITVYVSDPATALANSPWGATNASIVYKQA